VRQGLKENLGQNLCLCVWVCVCNTLDVFVRLVGWLAGCLRVRECGCGGVCGRGCMFVVLDVCVCVQADLVGGGFQADVFTLLMNDPCV
jgi:hypothetical protein